MYVWVCTCTRRPELTSADILQKMHILGGRVSQRTWRSMILLGWLARELQGSLCPSLPSAGITSSNHQAWLSHRGSWGLNSGPCDYRASALLTEPFLLSTESLVSVRLFFFVTRCGGCEERREPDDAAPGCGCLPAMNSVNMTWSSYSVDGLFVRAEGCSHQVRPGVSTQACLASWCWL